MQRKQTKKTKNEQHESYQINVRENRRGNHEWTFQRN